MMKNIVSFGLFVVIMLSFTAAGLAEESMDAKVRIIHAIPDAPAVDVYADNGLVLEEVEFTDVSEYLALPGGTHTIEIFAAGDTETALLTEDVTVEAGEKYTLAVTGEVEATSLVVMVDDQTTSDGKAKIRVAHFSSDTPAIDVATTEGDLLFSTTSFAHAAEYVEVDPQTYDVEIRTAQSEAAVVELSGIELKKGTVYTAIAVGLSNGAPEFEVLLLTDHLPTPDDLPKTGLGGASDIR